MNQGLASRSWALAHKQCQAAPPLLSQRDVACSLMQLKTFSMDASAEGALKQAFHSCQHKFKQGREKLTQVVVFPASSLDDASCLVLAGASALCCPNGEVTFITAELAPVTTAPSACFWVYSASNPAWRLLHHRAEQLRQLPN